MHQETREKIGQRLQELRAAAGGPPLRKIAPLIGVSHTTLNELELAKKDAKINTYRKIAKYYGLKIGQRDTTENMQKLAEFFRISVEDFLVDR